MDIFELLREVHKYNSTSTRARCANALESECASSADDSIAAPCENAPVAEARSLRHCARLSARPQSLFNCASVFSICRVFSSYHGSFSSIL